MNGGGVNRMSEGEFKKTIFNYNILVIYLKVKET